MSQHGKAAEWTLNPVWTRLDRETHDEFGLLKLFLVSRALGEARRGPTQTVLS